MFSEMCHIYFPTYFICVVRLSKQSTHYYAYNNSTQHARLSKQYLFVPPPAPHFYRQMLALRGAFGRGDPQSPIANSRRKKASTLWACP